MTDPPRIALNGRMFAHNQSHWRGDVFERGEALVQLYKIVTGAPSDCARLA